MKGLADVARTACRLMAAFDAPFDDGWDKRFDSAMSNMRAAVRSFERIERLRQEKLP